MAQLTSWSPIFCRILRCFATKEMSAQPGIRTPDLLHVKPVCYHYATATSCNIELKVRSLNHLKYSLVSNFLSEINKAISYFIYLLNTLPSQFLFEVSTWTTNSTRPQSLKFGWPISDPQNCCNLGIFRFGSV